jgi:hypothetical protein
VTRVVVRPANVGTTSARSNTRYSLVSLGWRWAIVRSMDDLIPVSAPVLTVGPGQRLRFFVIDAADGRRSMTWTVKTEKNSLDAYVWARSMGAIWKISLHESGNWYAGYHGLGIDRFVASGAGRHFDKWRRPDEFQPGFHRSIEVVFPDSELRTLPAGATEPSVRRGEKIVAIPAPGAGNVAAVEIVFGPAGEWPQAIVFDAAYDVATLVRPDGSVLRVVALQRPWDEADRVRVQGQRDEFLSRVPPDWWSTVAAPRGCFLGAHDDDGVRFVIDAAADPPASLLPM